jgi:hypothetical protein
VNVQTITSVHEVEEFVALLRSPSRTAPVVAISTQSRSSVPLIDADKIAAELGNTATVFLIKTGPLTYALEELMVEGTHIYGGAGRTYQPGTAWEEDFRRSPLRFAYDAAGGVAATEQLIDDAAIPRGRATAPAKMASSAFNEDQLAFLAIVAASLSAPGPPVSQATKPGPPAANPLVATPLSSQVETALDASSPVEADPAPVHPEPGVKRLTGLAAVAANTQPAVVIEPSVVAEIGPKTGALNDALLRITALMSANVALQAEVIAGRAQAIQDCASRISDVSEENVSLLRQMDELRTRQAEQLTSLRKKAGKTETVVSDFQPELFLTDEDAVHHAVYLAWVARVPSTEKRSTPLPEFTIGSEFASSLGKLSAGQSAKAMKCVVDVLCDLARDSRGIHPLRGSVSTDASGIIRDDGATCQRAYIEQKVSSARRLHFWKLTNGTIELSRIVTHDDMKP